MSQAFRLDSTSTFYLLDDSKSASDPTAWRRKLSMLNLSKQPIFV